MTKTRRPRAWPARLSVCAAAASGERVRLLDRDVEPAPGDEVDGGLGERVRYAPGHAGEPDAQLWRTLRGSPLDSTSSRITPEPARSRAAPARAQLPHPFDPALAVGRGEGAQAAQVVPVRDPAVPITLRPRARAICSTAAPTPPDAPPTSRLCPGRTPTSPMMRRAVATTDGYPAASSKDSPSGIRAQADSTANSAYVSEPSPTRGHRPRPPRLPDPPPRRPVPRRRAVRPDGLQEPGPPEPSSRRG